jgi:hypothetical protein
MSAKGQKRTLRLRATKRKTQRNSLGY